MSAKDEVKLPLPSIRTTRSATAKQAPPNLNLASHHGKDVNYSPPLSALSSPTSPGSGHQTLPPLSAASATSSQLTPTSASAENTTSGQAAGAAKEKRKRSRVTPEQLAQLERIFVHDKSPTAQRRKEISEMLGMQERQTQIWFQNRRAKAKLQDMKRTSFTTAPSDVTPPRTPDALDPEVQALIHEDEPVILVPCLELSIGSWRRIATPPPLPTYINPNPRKLSFDLLAYFSATRRCLTWFIHSNGIGFKMEIPFDTITNTDFDDTPTHGPGQALVKFWLSRPPLFYLETSASQSMGGNRGRITIGGFAGGPTWKRCADWTEGTQATTVLRHDLIGSANSISSLLRVMRSGGNGFQIAPLNLINPSYMASYEAGLSRGANLQSPITSHGQAPPSSYSYQNSPMNRQRSFTGPPSFNIPYQRQPGQDQQSYSPLNSYVASHIPSPRNRSSLPNLDSSFSHGMPQTLYQPSGSGVSGESGQATADYGSSLLHPRTSLSQTPPSITPPIHEDHYSAGSGVYKTSASPPLLAAPYPSSDTLLNSVPDNYGSSFLTSQPSEGDHHLSEYRIH